MPVKRRVRLNRGSGFTLVETLLSVVILSVGLLGSAALLLQSLRTHAGSLQRLGATQLVRDMADRIRANLDGRAFYDTRSAPSAAPACSESAGCDIAERAADDLAHYHLAARALFPHDEATASVEYEPAIGPSDPARYVIALRWRDVRASAEGTDRVALQVLAQPPVAG
jgi:type IV pilus assembly protein PilV